MGVVKWPEIPDLPAALEGLLAQLPRGCVTTYGDLARGLGDAGAARWVGEYLVDHPHAAHCPCHRVVRVNGAPGLYIGGGSECKLARLAEEGTQVANGRVDLSGRVTRFETSLPLAPLLEWQRSLPQHLQARRVVKTTTVAGIDVAYPDRREAAAAGVVLDANSGEILWSGVSRVPAPFPYIPGYLTFRELPAMQAVWEAMQTDGHRPDVLFVDGNGYLHPRRAGVACALGAILDHPTIGIGKSLLCGRVDLDEMSAGDLRPITDAGEPIGVALKSRDHSRPIYVSVGNRIDLTSAVDLTRRWLGRHRVPDPIYYADRFSKQAARDRGHL